MIWLYLACALLALAALFLAAKVWLMRKAAREIRAGFAEKLENDTNTLIDISTRDKEMRRLAEEINVQLRHLREQRHRFTQGDAELKNAVTGISHDLRTPLTAISGYLDLLDKAEKSEAVNRYLEIIKERTAVLEQLTEELFRYSIITAPGRAAAPEWVDVKGLLEESLLALYAAFAKRGIQPVLRMPEGKVMRKLDRTSLSRVFANLLNNALKYSDGNLEICLTQEGELTFSNMAKDLSRVQVERLFDRFYTVENARRSTGLGLSIARILVEEMQGAIHAEYENGRLTIRLLLPAAE